MFAHQSALAFSGGGVLLRLFTPPEVRTRHKITPCPAEAQGTRRGRSSDSS